MEGSWKNVSDRHFCPGVFRSQTHTTSERTYISKKTMLTITYDPVFGHKFRQHVPFSRYYTEYNIKGPMNFYEPTRTPGWYPHYWPAHLMERTPTSYSVRSLRLRNHLYKLSPKL